MRPSHVRLFDHPPEDRSVAPVAGAPAAGVVPDDAVPDSYGAAFARVQEHLHAGNTYEANLTYRLARESGLDPVTAYLRLRELNPAPYAGFLQHDVPGHRAWLLSSSPERYALITADRHLETKPIKGTTPRGATPAEDAVLRERLRTEPKFRSENLMILDLLRNDLSMVCEPGTVEVPVLMEVESYPSVHQLVSTVRGRLRDDVSTVRALHALFPAGSMTGAPKLRTMAVIEEVESSPRGVYAGAFGWLAADGRADLGVVIRLADDRRATGLWSLGHRRRDHGPLRPGRGVRRVPLEGGAAAAGLRPGVSPRGPSEALHAFLRRTGLLTFLLLASSWPQRRSLAVPPGFLAAAAVFLAVPLGFLAAFLVVFVAVEAASLAGLHRLGREPAPPWWLWPSPRTRRRGLPTAPRP